MNIIFLTLGVSIAIALLFLGFFIWAARRGQYDDLKTPGYRMLLDDYDNDKKNMNKSEEKDL